jgi:hypothetical protein
MDHLFALKSELAVPLKHVMGAVKDEEEARGWCHGVRAPGTNVPGPITAGTFHQHGERVFWDVRHPDRAIAISLSDESYGKLVIEVDDPDATILAIEAAVGGRKFAGGSSRADAAGPARRHRPTRTFRLLRRLSRSDFRVAIMRPSQRPYLANTSAAISCDAPPASPGWRASRCPACSRLWRHRRG